MHEPVHGWVAGTEHFTQRTSRCQVLKRVLVMITGPLSARIRPQGGGGGGGSTDPKNGFVGQWILWAPEILF